MMRVAILVHPLRLQPTTVLEASLETVLLEAANLRWFMPFFDGLNHANIMSLLPTEE